MSKFYKSSRRGLILLLGMMLGFYNVKPSRRLTARPKISKLLSPNPVGITQLADGDTLRLLPGDVLSGKIVVPAYATVSITGSGDFGDNIELADSSSVLRFDLQNKLKTDLVLNGGKIVLDNDLSFANGCSILGDGTIDINSMKIKFPKGYLPAGKITYLNANDISLEGNTMVSAAQTFSGVGLDSDVNGYGFFWQFASGGYISVDVDHTLHLVGLHIKDFGNYPTSGYFDIDATSTIVIQNCTLDLAGDYVHDQGTIIFNGDNNKIISHDYTFTTSANAQLIVDGVSLTYDSLDAPNKNPLVFTDVFSQKQLINGGLIRSVYTPPTLNIYSTTPVFTENYMLTDNAMLNFKNSTPDIPKSVLLNCSGHAIYFPLAGDPLFNLDQNITVTLQNAVLHGFKKDVVGYADSSSNLVFGDSVHIRLFEDSSLSSSDRVLAFVGDSEICGSGITLTLDASCRIIVDNASTLTLKSLRLVIKIVDAIKCLDSASKVVFENCSLILDAGGFEWSKGNIDVNGELEIFGGDTALVDTQTTFSFTSSGFLTVLSGSNLIIDRGIIFKYQADPSEDGGLLFSQKRHFKLADPTSTLTLNGATLYVTTTAMALDYGRMVIDDIVIIKIDGNLYDHTEVELGSCFIIIIRPCAVFDIQGSISYNKTYFP